MLLAAQVLACLRMELFRTLLMERIEFFDRHAAAELAGLLSVELDAVRAFVFGNVSRDRGARAALEATGAVAVLFVLSWRLGPVLAAVIVVRPMHGYLHHHAWVFAASLLRKKNKLPDALEATGAVASRGALFAELAPGARAGRRHCGACRAHTCSILNAKRTSCALRWRPPRQPQY